MSRPNPRYSGDYFAQSLAEVKGFNRQLQELLKKKAEGLVLSFPEIILYLEYDYLNIVEVIKYAKEKLSVANPSIYVSEFDELMLGVKNCLIDYCNLIDKSEKDIANELDSFHYSDYSEPYKNPFYIQSNFCIEFKKAYLKIRNSLRSKDNIEDDDMDFQAQILLDEDTLLNILKETLTQVSEKNLQIICHCIIYKQEFPITVGESNIALEVRQGVLITMIKKIRKELNLTKNSRAPLSELFGSIPRTYINGKPKYYNVNTIYSQI